MFVNLLSRKAVNFDENGGVMQIHLIFRQTPENIESFCVF